MIMGRHMKQTAIMLTILLGTLLTGRSMAEPPRNISQNHAPQNHAPQNHAPQNDHVLHVRIDNVRVATGTIHVDICTAAQFLKDCSWSGHAPAAVPSTMVAVRGVPAGRYGAQIYHDKNGNGKLDRNFLGIPREGVGFSNDAKIKLKPPRFADAAFQYDGGSQTIHLNLRYF